MSAEKKARKAKGSPKGTYVNLPEDLKTEISTRCEESMRTPSQEIAWILRDWMRGQEEEKE